MANLATIERNGSALAQWNDEQINLLKTQIAPRCSDSELALFGQVCQRTGLDPFMKQIYAVKRGAGDKAKMVIQVGIDGFWSIAEESGECGGCDEPLFDEGITIDQVEMEGRKQPRTAKVKVYRLVQGVRCGFEATATWREYAPTDMSANDAFMWRKMPFHMLAKCAESKALRKAFPKRLSGLYTREEMMRADIEATTVEVQPVDPRRAELMDEVMALVQQLGWTKKQASQFLQQQFGKATRDALTTDELADAVAMLSETLYNQKEQKAIEADCMKIGLEELT